MVDGVCLYILAVPLTVGYIVGLGDRHIQNILIDEQTAELVHIDLGECGIKAKTNFPVSSVINFFSSTCRVSLDRRCF